MKTVSIDSTAKFAASRLKLLDFEPAQNDVRAEVLEGLSQAEKKLPCKLFYDQRGSELFDAICELPEYYPTRTELTIMRDHASEMAAAMGPDTLLVEYGSGSSLKTRVLLDQLPDASGYVPIDISRSHLLRSAKALQASYPQIPVRPVCADYTRPFWLPSFEDRWPGRINAYFPGSTIGNFEPDQALAFLQTVRTTCGPGSGLLIGVDLKKDPALLHAAYNDAAGITANFNLNILHRINREIGANFDLDSFKHYAFYDPVAARMQMHLISQKTQQISLGNDITVNFENGESIHTECCHKYTLETFARLASTAGYQRERVWTDPKGWFSVQYFVSSRDKLGNICS